MKPPYDPSELDAFMNSAIEFDDVHHEAFYAGNISGLGSVGADQEFVKRMAEWFAETDKGLIENLGVAPDNINYFRIGLDAKDVMKRGGMGPYLARRKRTERREKTRMWVPIFISVIAIVFTALNFFAPKRSDRKIEELDARLLRIEAENRIMVGSLRSLQARVDGLTAQIPRERAVSK